MEPKQQPLVSKEEVAKHNTIDDLWMILDNNVIDFTVLCNEYPFVVHVDQLLPFAGTDVSEKFHELFKTLDRNMLLSYCVGVTEKIPMTDKEWYLQRQYAYQVQRGKEECDLELEAAEAVHDKKNSALNKKSTVVSKAETNKWRNIAIPLTGLAVASAILLKYSMNRYNSLG